VNFRNVRVVPGLLLSLYCKILADGRLVAGYNSHLFDSSVIIPAFVSKMVVSISTLSRGNGDKFLYTFGDGTDDVRTCLRRYLVSTESVDFKDLSQDVLVSGNTPDTIKHAIINTLNSLINCETEHQLVGIVLSDLNMLFRWYRYQEVKGVEASSLIKSILSNPQDSKPLGCRNYLKIDEQHVLLPDGLKVNAVNLYLSIIFVDSSSLIFPDGHKIQISSFGLNNTYVQVNCDSSYWTSYLTRIVYVLNQDKINGDYSPKVSAKKNKSITDVGFGRSQFHSAAFRGQSRMLEDYFSTQDELTLYLARAYIPDFLPNRR
jgi:hypothetical protein